MAVADCYGEIAAYFMGIRHRENRFARTPGKNEIVGRNGEA